MRLGTNRQYLRNLNMKTGCMRVSLTKFWLHFNWRDRIWIRLRQCCSRNHKCSMLLKIAARETTRFQARRVACLNCHKKLLWSNLNAPLLWRKKVGLKAANFSQMLQTHRNKLLHSTFLFKISWSSRQLLTNSSLKQGLKKLKSIRLKSIISRKTQNSSRSTWK